ncbi:MAG TPA: coproporphyrinogen III oxidase [Clostridiaceae bacterium]|nr:coproporphyrinogen III oxidase [Clostridiaceae bacterium]
MIINIELNDMSYRYDVFQIFNIYFISKDISFNLGGGYRVHISDSEISCSLEGVIKRTFSYDEGLRKRENIRIGIFLFLKEITKQEYPWGTLIGIRPSKIAMKLMEDQGDEEVIEYFRRHNLASREKAKLCIEVARNEEKYVSRDKKIISVYVGMPFCPTKCLYCSFTSNPVGENSGLVDDYLKALFYELDRIREYIKQKGLKVQCVYFGGGTPTAVNDKQFELVMKKICGNFMEKSSVEEFTVECGRPDSLNEAKLLTMKQCGVGRISINPQTMNDETLRLIGRNHSAEDIREKFGMARRMGFDNINMDMIVGLPGEDLDHVRKTCSEIRSLNPENITVHGLSIKRGSRLFEKIIYRETCDPPRQEEVIDMFRETKRLAGNLGMKPYYMYRQKNMVGNMENIGYSKDGRDGLYNIQMIEERQTIIACGADGVTKLVFHDEAKIGRFPNLKDIREYCSRIEETTDKKIDLLNTLYK